MKHRIFIFLFLNLIPYVAFSQKYAVNSNFGIEYATIYLASGDSIKGQLDYPLTMETYKIKSKGENKQTYKIEDINKIIYKTTSNGLIEYDVLPYYKDGSSGKIANKKMLVLLSMKGKRTNLYIGSSTFLESTYYCCKRENEPAMTIVNVEQYGRGIGIGYGRYFKNAPEYFADNQAIVNKIKSGKYISKNIMEIVMEYNAAP